MGRAKKWEAAKLAVNEWNLDKWSKKRVEETGERLLNRIQEIYDQLKGIKPPDATFDNFLKKWADLQLFWINEWSPLRMMHELIKKGEVREAAEDATKSIQDLMNKIAMDKHLFDCLTQLESRLAEEKNVSKQYLWWIHLMTRDAQTNGLYIESDDMRKKFLALRRSIFEQGMKLMDNCDKADDNTFLYLTAAELEGVPEDTIATYEVTGAGGEKKLKVPITKSTYESLLSYCKVDETKRKIFEAHFSKCMDTNPGILDSIVNMRHRLATDFLNFENYAISAQELQKGKNREKTVEEAHKLLTDLLDAAVPKWRDEEKQMLELKEAACKEKGTAFNNKLEAYEIPYYQAEVLKKIYKVDSLELRKYFPLDSVIEGMFETYKSLFGWDIVEIEHDVMRWHEDVRKFEVKSEGSGEVIGQFFLDIHPREDKFKQTSMRQLQPGCISSVEDLTVEGTATPDAKRQLPLCMINANFPKPVDGEPTLLDIQQVRNLFHEFGHVMQGIAAKTLLAHLSRPIAAGHLFFETPSRMFEQLVYDKKTLRRITRHYRTNKPMPEEMLNALIESRNASAGYYFVEACIRARLDLIIHTSPFNDRRNIHKTLTLKHLGIELPDSVDVTAIFIHLDGYGALYHTYLLGDVRGASLLSQFPAGDLSHPQTGRRFLECFFQQGASKDANDMIRQFLNGEDCHISHLIAQAGLFPVAA